MRFKSITVLFGALIASSFATPMPFCSGGQVVAADATAMPAGDGVKVPEFVPVVNFSQFVRAIEKFAAENPDAGRLAAEQLSAKFITGAEPQNIDIHPEASIITTRPVVTARVSEMAQPLPAAAESEPSLPAVPDPGRPALALADPVKVATALRPHDHPAARSKRETTEAETSRARIEKKFEPAMGLGMFINSAEDAPPISSMTTKKRTVTSQSAD